MAIWPTSEQNPAESHDANDPQTLMMLAKGQSASERLGEALYKGRILAWFVLLFASLFVNLLAEGYKASFFIRLTHGLMDALAIASILALISETPLFKNYLERRFSDLLETSDTELLRQFAKVAESNIIAQVQDPRIMRSLEPSVLERVEQAIQVTPFRSPLPAEVLHLMERLSKLRKDFAIWRSKNNWTLEYIDIDGHPEAYRLISTKYFEYHNCGNEDVEIEQAMVSTCSQIATFPDNELFKRTLLKLNNVSILPEKDPDPVRVGNEVRFEGRFTVRLPADSTKAGATVEEITEMINARAQAWVIRFKYPAKGIAVRLIHPPTVKPKLYVFGIGGKQDGPTPLDPVEAKARFHRWSFDGWCLPSHGFVLLFAEDPVSPEIAAQAS
jgi:hypothetical protein